MKRIKINGISVQVEDHWTLLEACRFYGIDIPTLCYYAGLSPGGLCRLCVVEIGKGERTKLVTSCNYPVEERLVVRTHSEGVMRTRKMLVELLLARCPSSKTLQDLAAKMGLQRVRFRVKNENCILCGLCVRMCAEQMRARAIGFASRGKDRRVTPPFDIKSEECRKCGACLFICPACQLRCQGPQPPNVVCGACMNIEPVCLEKHEDVRCYLDTCGSCLSPYRACGKAPPGLAGARAEPVMGQSPIKGK